MRRPRRARTLLPLLGVLLAVVVVTVTTAVITNRTQVVRGASHTPVRDMPTHFAFGIMSAPGDASYLVNMRQQNGTAWDYRYQYLAGGVNTGKGWTTWNSPAGAFVTDYINESTHSGIRPAFVYYQMLQSKGASPGGEQANDIAHLQDPAVMQAYFADWTTLMQTIGKSKTPVLVIVEPDLWGYIESATLKTGRADAASMPASVASSGNVDAKGFPNTAQGFAWALLHIRDTYAPNAVLALHASPWGNGKDVAGSQNPLLDVTDAANQTAAFLESAGLSGTPTGVHPFDLISLDIADHDSGQSGIWWDTSNITYPNFARLQFYIGELSSSTSKHVLLWQVPVGNQYYDTENNTPGHTQDNKAAYFLNHIADLVTAGVVGVLFGPGNGGTNVFDSDKDGTTNPAPISTYDCNRCNSHTSRYPDDDGGFLRIQLGKYYRGGAYPLNG